MISGISFLSEHQCPLVITFTDNKKTEVLSNPSSSKMQTSLTVLPFYAGMCRARPFHHYIWPDSEREDLPKSADICTYHVISRARFVSHDHMRTVLSCDQL